MKMIDNNAFDNTDNSSVDDDDSFLNDLDFIKLLIVAKTNLHWLILIVLIGLFAAYGYNRYSQPVFESSSIIKLDIKSDASALGFGGVESVNANLSGEVELIQSKLIHERALSLLDMEVSYFAEGNINSQELYRSSPFRVSFELKNPGIYDQKINVNIIDNKSFYLGYELNGEFVEKNIISDRQLKTMILNL